MKKIYSEHQLVGHSIGRDLLPAFVEVALSIPQITEFLAGCLKIAAKEVGAEELIIMRGVKGTWRLLASSHANDPSPSETPYELLSESLDSNQAQFNANWVVVPLDFDSTSGRVLVLKLGPSDLDATEFKSAKFHSLAAAISFADTVFRCRMTPIKRAERLSAILELSAHWNQSRETDQLLVEIAEASTRLLGSERATIFLPDSAGKTLIGRPALGVESGEIQIAIGAGVVGSVVATGQPQRVDSDVADEQKQINRSVDDELNFQTRSLLCVPLINSDGKTIGAFELINKIQGNFTDEDQSALAELAAHAAVAIENTQHVEQLASTNKAVADQAADQIQLIGKCGQLEELKSTIGRIAHTDLAILITGENGTGKEVVAQLIHYLSDRRDKVLVAVNCAAITESLLESELFGHEKGAFTDAHRAREGKFELADQGTLFLDEIGDMSMGGQAKLLRVLEEKVVVRVGGSTSIPTSARILAATNQDLVGLVREKKFREDLFFRLNVVTLQVPPLRDRGDDILLLAEHFLNEFCKKARRDVLKLSDEAQKKLLHHAWPGNVRELRNMMERLAYLSPGNVVEPADLDFINAPGSENEGVPMDLTLSEATKRFQADYIRRHIDRSAGNMTDTAGKLGLHRSNLYRKMRQLGMRTDDDNDSDA